jgi:hypothetical protein
VVAIGVTDDEPDRPPPFVQPPAEVQLSAPVELHVNTLDVPATTDRGDAEKLTLGDDVGPEGVLEALLLAELLVELADELEELVVVLLEVLLEELLEVSLELLSEEVDESEEPESVEDEPLDEPEEPTDTEVLPEEVLDAPLDPEPPPLLSEPPPPQPATSRSPAMRSGLIHRVNAKGGIFQVFITAAL